MELSSLLIMLFAILTVIGVIGTFFMDKLPSYLSTLQDLADPFGTWAYWMVVAGPVGLIACVWWFYDYVKKTRDLSKLIDTPSKAKFVRNLDDIEYLAWSLPQRFEDKVLAKKKEFGVQ